MINIKLQWIKCVRYVRHYHPFDIFVYQYDRERKPSGRSATSTNLVTSHMTTPSKYILRFVLPSTVWPTAVTCAMKVWPCLLVKYIANRDEPWNILQVLCTRGKGWLPSMARQISSTTRQLAEVRDTSAYFNGAPTHLPSAVVGIRITTQRSTRIVKSISSNVTYTEEIASTFR